jgi:ABC-2 type transport system ATP-binding protein
LNLFAAFASEAADVDRLLRDWGLWDKRGAAFDSLSGGQRQRLFVAIALVNMPRVVFLDELTTGLDPAARRTAWDLVRRVRDGGATVVLVTHFMDEAQSLCDRLAVIDGGRVVACDAPSALVATHSTGRITFTIPADRHDLDIGFLASVPGAENLERDGSRVTVTGGGPLLQHVAAALLGAGVEVPDLGADLPGLEDVFLRLTGHAMRDD